MIERGGGNRGENRPPAKGRGGRPSAPGRRPGPSGAKGGPSRRGGLGLKRLGGDDFVLVHPKCVREMELDYEEGIELRKAGDPEAARDALRFALQGCGDNIWVHVALGPDRAGRLPRPDAWPAATSATPSSWPSAPCPATSRGRLPREHPSNRPLYDAVDGLITCHEALGAADLAGELRRRLAGVVEAGWPPAAGLLEDGCLMDQSYARSLKEIKSTIHDRSMDVPGRRGRGTGRQRQTVEGPQEARRAGRERPDAADELRRRPGRRRDGRRMHSRSTSGASTTASSTAGPTRASGSRSS